MRASSVEQQLNKSINFSFIDLNIIGSLLFQLMCAQKQKCTQSVFSLCSPADVFGSVSADQLFVSGRPRTTDDLFAVIHR